MLRFLGRKGYGFYIYAPKDDNLLRRDWRTPYDEKALSELRDLSIACHTEGLAFGIGFCPYAINWPPAPAGDLAPLRTKLEQISKIGVDVLAVLFDDVSNDATDLAGREAAVAQGIAELSGIDRVIHCPTYYSDDPVLDRVFGRRPDDYLGRLGRLMPDDIGLFWTGPLVISGSFPNSHLERVTDEMRRAPFIWDNALANDGRRTTAFLNLFPPEDRDLNFMSQVAGLAINPMNQPELSQIPLHMISKSLKGLKQRSAAQALPPAVQIHLDPELADLVIRDSADFYALGLDALDRAGRLEKLKSDYGPFTQTAVGAEIYDWLSGEYAFDPECLT
jgi:hyaluronoglucosaminidase